MNRIRRSNQGRARSISDIRSAISPITRRCSLGSGLNSRSPRFALRSTSSFTESGTIS